jgi:hypothetical protein
LFDPEHNLVEMPIDDADVEFTRKMKARYGPGVTGMLTCEVIHVREIFATSIAPPRSMPRDSRSILGDLNLIGSNIQERVGDSPPSFRFCGRGAHLREYRLLSAELVRIRDALPQGISKRVDVDDAHQLVVSDDEAIRECVSTILNHLIKDKRYREANQLWALYVLYTSGGSHIDSNAQIANTNRRLPFPPPSTFGVLNRTLDDSESVKIWRVATPRSVKWSQMAFMGQSSGSVWASGLP